ncbi:MAG: transporter substrate-binding domain-containing protein [Lachnospiraceae bacterium]|nr:transporter substrate-binding domain-containing protein [Lachnospiraceae bacterium]
MSACGSTAPAAQESAAPAAQEETAEAPAAEEQAAEEPAAESETEAAAEASAEAPSEGAAEAEGQYAQILSSGKMVAAMEGDWAPWSFHDVDSGEVVGFDADVARAIGEKLGVEVEIVEAPWESLFAGLDSGRYDIVVNGVEFTEERAAKYDFATPYAYIRTALIVREDNEEIQTFKDLAGKKTVNSLASTYMTMAEEYGASAVGVSTLNDTLQNVLDGRADATLNATVSFYDYMREHPDAPLKIAAETEEASQVVIPIRKGEESFVMAVSDAVEELRAEGKLAELSEKYFGSDITAE